MPLLIIAWSVDPIFVTAGFDVGKGCTVLTGTIFILLVIGLSSFPLGEVPRAAVSPLPVTLFFLVSCSNPNKFRVLVLQHGLGYDRHIVRLIS